MSRRIRLKFLIAFWSVSDIFGLQQAAAETVIGDVPLKDNPNVMVGRPQSQTDSSVVISRRQYVISWDFERHIPEWVAWAVNKRVLGDVTRSDDFRRDQDLDEALLEQNRESVSPKDYLYSCLDRGHQVPSGDRTATETDNESTFLMSNVMPQSAYLNRRSWVGLERFVRRRVLAKNERAQVYVGYAADPAMRTIGPRSDIHVPAANFKIIVLMPATRQKPNKADMRFFAVSFPNVTSRGTNPVDDRSQACWDSEHTARLGESHREANWRPFLTPLAEVERISGLSFDFLENIHEMQPAEVDGLIAEDLSSQEK